MMPEQQRLTDNLRILNRKERFFLIGQALGNPTFELCDEFRAALSETIGITVPADAFVAMDYHLNWLYAALVLTYKPNATGLYSNDRGWIQDNQEDVDLLVAWDRPEPHIVVIEAKGATYFTNKQMESKLERLAAIFGRKKEQTTWDSVKPHLCLISPRESKGLRTCKAPGWAVPDGKFTWIPLEHFDRFKLKAVTRCDANGTPCATGTHWTLARG